MLEACIRRAAALERRKRETWPSKSWFSPIGPYDQIQEFYWATCSVRCVHLHCSSQLFHTDPDTSGKKAKLLIYSCYCMQTSWITVYYFVSVYYLYFICILFEFLDTDGKFTLPNYELLCYLVKPYSVYSILYFYVVLYHFISPIYTILVVVDLKGFICFWF